MSSKTVKAKKSSSLSSASDLSPVLAPSGHHNISSSSGLEKKSPKSSASSSSTKSKVVKSESCPLTINNNTKSNIIEGIKSLSEEELKELKTAFYLIDKDHDGRVTVQEFQIMLNNFGIEVPDKLVLCLIKQASSSGAGILNETEFLDWISSFLIEITDDLSEDLLAAFRVFDKDNNGYITKDELKSAMDMISEPLTDEEINELLVLADIDKDGRIDYEEFARLLS